MTINGKLKSVKLKTILMGKSSVNFSNSIIHWIRHLRTVGLEAHARTHATVISNRSQTSLRDCHSVSKIWGRKKLHVTFAMLYELAKILLSVSKTFVYFSSGSL